METNTIGPVQLELDIYINGFTNKIDVIQNIIDKCQDGNGYDAIDDLQALKEVEEKEKMRKQCQ